MISCQNAYGICDQLTPCEYACKTRMAALNEDTLAQMRRYPTGQIIKPLENIIVKTIVVSTKRSRLRRLIDWLRDW